MSDAKKDAVNKDLDKAIKDLLKESKGEPFDMRVKALTMAINWEKAKHSIKGDDDFDVNDL